MTRAEGARPVGIDVVVVNYNAGPMLARVVAAVHAQTAPDVRLVIIDNGSTDASLDGLPDGAVPVEIVRAGRNLGFAGGNNLALREHLRPGVEWVALLNPDAFPRPDWLARMLAAAAQAPDFRFFGCRLVDAGDAGRLDGVGDVYHVSGLHWREGHGAPDREDGAVPREIFGPCAAAALYRAEDLREVGGFDEDFFCYAEDVDLAFRLRLAGRRCLYVPDAVVAHVGSGITGVSSDFAVYHGHRNLVWVYVKDMPGALFWRHLPAHIALNLASIVAFALKGRAGVMLRAKRDALRGLPAMLGRRRAVQAGRTVAPAALRAVMQGGWWPRRGR